MTIAAVLALSLPGITCPQDDATSDAPPPRRVGRTIEAKSAMIVGTTAPVAIHAGADVLERGGSAVDAALTTALAQTTLCAGCWVSFAGRLTALVYDAESGEIVALNACYDAPRGEDDPASIPTQPTPSGRTALVPGFMAGVGALHERFGDRPFAELFEPSIRLAEDGFELTPNLARLIRNKRDVLLRTEQGRRVFLDTTGELHAVGSVFRQPDLARTLRGTARDGWGYFYGGPWGERFVEVVQAHGGKITREDLELYRPTWQEPSTVAFGGALVHGMPAPNRGGSMVTLALNLAARAAATRDGARPDTARALHDVASIDRALRVVWTDRGRRALGDLAPDTSALWEASFASEAGGQALWDAMNGPHWSDVLQRTRGPVPKAGDHSDSIVAVDPRGNVVAMIHTINTAGWGTTGLFVDGVSIPDSAASQQRSVAAVGPGGRVPDHGVPMIATRDGRPVLAASATGSGNVQTVWQNAIRVLGHDAPASAVADGPYVYRGRVRDGAFPEETISAVREAGFPLGTVERFGGFERGYWVGVTLDDEAPRLRAAAVSGLGGVAVGLERADSGVPESGR